MLDATSATREDDHAHLMPITTNRALAIAAALNSVLAVTAMALSSAHGFALMQATAMLALAAAASQTLLWLALQRARSAGGGPVTSSPAAELTFWSYVVAAMVYSLGAGAALSIAALRATSAPLLIGTREAFSLLATTLLAQLALVVLARSLSATASGSPRAPASLVAWTLSIEGAAGVTAAVIGLAGLAAAAHAAIPSADAIAAGSIGVAMGYVAARMALETKRIIVAASPAGATPELAGPPAVGPAPTADAPAPTKPHGASVAVASGGGARETGATAPAATPSAAPPTATPARSHAMAAPGAAATRTSPQAGAPQTAKRNHPPQQTKSKKKRRR
jgi:hypothetical protein